MTIDVSTPAETSARLALVIGRLTRRLRTARGGLSQGLLSALASVAKHGPLRLADLAQIELVSAPSITRIVADLEAHRLVSRSSDPDDGRASPRSATPAGADAVALARRAREETLAQLFGVLDGGDIAAIEAALPALERMIEP
jgi:DNA-binding MarR family transcriptional regulator